MTVPLTLPQPLKRLARAVRDHPPTNQFITGIARQLLPLVPERHRSAFTAHVPRVGKASARLPGGQRLQMWCPEPESILNAIHYRGWAGEEPETLPLWLALAERARTVLDVGAHVGHFSLVAAYANPDACIIGFEPLARIAERFRGNVTLNRLNVGLRQCALGRTPGRLPFFAYEEHGMPSSSSLSREFMESANQPLVAVDVEVSTLDLEDIPDAVPVLMKIDTETTEPDVIAGGRNYLNRTKPVMIVEVLAEHDTSGALHSALQEAGIDFDSYLLTGEGPKASELRGNPHWRNFLIVPRDGPSVSGFRPALRQFGIRC
jgi:FkbM family methyltransferase